MHNKQFYAYVAKQHNCTLKEATKCVKMFIGSIVSSLNEGQEVTLISFGRFHFRQAKARRAHNPNTGQYTNIPARVKTVFSVGKKIKDTAKNIEVKHG